MKWAAGIGFFLIAGFLFLIFLIWAAWPVQVPGEGTPSGFYRRYVAWYRGWKVGGSAGFGPSGAIGNNQVGIVGIGQAIKDFFSIPWNPKNNL